MVLSVNELPGYRRVWEGALSLVLFKNNKKNEKKAALYRTAFSLYLVDNYLPNILKATVTPAITTDTIDINLIRIFIEGPHVSLNGSPTVSPTILALWHSLFLPP